MPEPTPSQLKIDGMPETEVLRISGNVTVPKEISANQLLSDLIFFIDDTYKGNAGALTVVPQDSPTGMRLYRVAEANKIIGESLKANEGYLHYLFINNLENTQNQIIYIPTEAGLPILEAGRLKDNNKLKSGE